MSSSKVNGAAGLVRSSLVGDLKVHVRLVDQGLAPDQGQREAIARALPDLLPFGSNEFVSVACVLDWDHQLPTQHTILRVLASYSDHESRRVETELRARDGEIAEDNLYPEFDLPDYGEIEASEIYAAVLEPGATKIEDLRFLSEWRKHVTPRVAQPVLKTVRGSKTYKQAMKVRAAEGLGAAVVVGWAPPCLAEADNWAIEVWLITEFDGQSGKARVFMVDSESHRITREFETEVHLA